MFFKRNILNKLFLGLALATSLIMGQRMPFWAQFSQDDTRRTHYAGSWYEADAEKLKKQLADFLANADKTMIDGKSTDLLAEQNPPIVGEVTAIIVPHAGYIFSGQTAAFGYQSAHEQKINRIFLLGPSHHIAVHGAALPLATRFQTPLGDLEVDKDVVEELRSYPLFSTQPDVHKIEHSLEMQLPFIRQVFGTVKIIPIVIGQLADESEARLIGEILKGYVGKHDLLIVSSDFTHYGPRYQYTPFKENVEANIRQLDKQAFSHLSNNDLDGFAHFQASSGDTICGANPCQVLSAMLPEGSVGTLLKYASSSDNCPTDKDNSVSYMAIAFSGGSWPEKPGQPRPPKEVINLSDEDRQTLLTLARKTLTNYITKRRIPTPSELGVTISPPLKNCFGIFVTLNKSTDKGDKNEHGELRGCVGSIYPTRPLYQAVQENVVAAATRDYRFKPVEPSELPHIQVDINVLTPPRRIKSYQDIVLGRDGIILSKNGQQAVFLPQVAIEWGWSLAETLTQLSIKAGLHKDDWKEGAKFDIFQSEEFH